MTQLDIVTELYLDRWVEVTDKTRLADGIGISGGRPNETPAVNPGSCSLTLDNREGEWLADNPLGPYYGILSRNTPLRVARRLVLDRFARTVASGWGDTDTGQTWDRLGAGGSVVAADWNVAAGVGTMSQPAVGGFRISVLDGDTHYRDVDVLCDVTLPFGDVTGGDLEPGNIVLRYQGSSAYYTARLVITSAEVVTLSWHHSSAGQLVAPVTVAGLTHSGQTLRVRAQAEGHTLRAKVWAAAADEPYDWTVSVHDELITVAGAVGVRCGVASANTNALPVVFSIDNFQACSMRFSGEVSAWPPRWDISGEDATTPIEASGLMRRLGQGSPALRSALFRGITTSTRSSLRAYWPCEDSRGSTSIASGIGGFPMRVIGEPGLAASSVFDCSAPLPAVSGSSWIGDVPGYAGTGVVQLRFLLAVPSGGSVDDRIIARMGIGGTASLWELVYYAGGGLGLKAYTNDGTQVLTTGAVGFNVDGALRRVSIELKQSGSDVDWRFSTLEVGESVGGFTSGTLVGYVVDQCLQVQINPQGAMTDVVVGHVSLEDQLTTLFSLWQELNAHRGEAAARRAIRLCAEEDIPLSYVGDPDDTALMGAQGIDTVLGLLEDCAKADLGTLAEARGAVELVYRSRASLNNQAATVTLDLSAGEVGHPIQPEPDDALTANDVTVERTNGSSYRVVKETGPMSVLPPQQGGIGRAEGGMKVNVSTDEQLPPIAGFVLHQGTEVTARYPQVPVKLHNTRISGDPVLLGSLLSVGVDDRLVVTNAQEIHRYTDIDQVARGWSEQIGLVEHDLKFNCSPNSAYQVIELDSDAFGKLDSSSSTLDRAVTSGATSLVVRSTREKWTTDAAEMPIPITIGGEEMSVSAIGSATPAFIAAGAAVHGSNASVTPPLPAGSSAGALLLLAAAIRNSGAGAPDAAALALLGYSRLIDAGNVGLFAKYDSGAEVAPLVPFTGGVANATTTAQMCAFSGLSLSPVILPVSQLNAAAQDIAYPGSDPSTPHVATVYIRIGWKADDWTSVAAIPGMTEIGDVSSTLGDDQGLVWDFVLNDGPVLPGAKPAGSFVVTGGASAISRGLAIGLVSTQTFTVTRATNGVVKAHAVGAGVHVTRPATIAL